MTIANDNAIVIESVSQRNHLMQTETERYRYTCVDNNQRNFENASQEVDLEILGDQEVDALMAFNNLK